MSLILTRSPYFVSKGNLENATLKLEVGGYGAGSFFISKTYNFVFRNSYLLDISPFMLDELSETFSWGTVNYQNDRGSLLQYARITVGGDIAGTPQADVVTEHFMAKGYLYSTDDYNKDFSQDLIDNCYYAGSSDVLYRLDDNQIRVPLLSTEQTLISGGVSPASYRVDYLKLGEVEKSISGSFSSSGSTENYVFLEEISGNGMFDNYRRRINDESGVLEESSCLDDFLSEYALFYYDEIRISANGRTKSIKVVTIEECKHKPYRATYLNKYGVQEDLWFFKRSTKELSIKRDSFRLNSIGRYNWAGNTSNTRTSGVKTFQNFNVNGRERIMLNSGFVDERMNESFKQMLLSDEITLYDFDEDKTYNVNISDSSFKYKDHTNDKLINYEIEFEFAHEVINNVG